MCGRYGFTVNDEKAILNRFDIEAIDFELNSSYNVAPTQEMPVVERHSPNSMHLRKWGVQPSWSKMFLINAKAETVETSSVWRKAFSESRCIIPASYFFEWKRLQDSKQPYLIRLKSKEMFGFAGLMVDYLDAQKQKQTGYVIITIEPNNLMANIHSRMPAILKREDEDSWLNPDIVEPEQLKKYLISYPESEMEAYPVSSLVNTPKNNIPEVTKPVEILSESQENI